MPTEWSPALFTAVHNLAFTLMQAALAGSVMNMYLFGVRANEVDTGVFRERVRPVWNAFIKTSEQQQVVDAIRGMGGGNA